MEPLTAFDIKALRTADDVVFKHLADGSGIVRAIKRADLSIPFSEDRHHEIKVDSGFTTYGDEPDRATPKTAFAVIGVFRFGRQTLATAFDALRKGDRIMLDWEVDAEANGYVKEAGLHADTLILLILRPNSRGGWRQVGGYHVATSVNPGNSARMVSY